MSGRLFSALPLVCATLLLIAGRAPFFWPVGLGAMALASVLVRSRATLSTFGALLWMIAGAAAPILWARSTTTDPRLGLSAAIFFLGIAAVRLFFDRPLFGRNFDRALVVFACIAEGIGVKSAAYPYGAVALAVALLVELGGGLPALRTWGRVPRAASSVVLLSIALAALVAFALPALDRATNRRFQTVFAGRLTSTRFTPDVRLDESDFIRTNDDIVLRLHGAEADYLRGAVFDTFNGIYWGNAPRRARPVLGIVTAGPPTHVDAVEASPWLFAPRDARIVSDDPWESEALGALRPVGRGLTQWSFAPTKDAVDPPGDPDLALPPRLAPTLKELALAWTAGAKDDRARAVALVRHLREDFTYTLDRPSPPRGQSALLDFLFVHREGHCEFFASAFVVLARAVGIPARLVTGYRVVEHNGFGGYAVVRAKHAHAWAEAYVAGESGGAGEAGGAGAAKASFQIFDPTPSAPTLIESRNRSAIAFLDYLWSSFTQLYDAAIASPERSVPALGALVAVAFVVRALRGRRRGSTGPADDAADAPPAAYLRFEAKLAQDGFVREGAETLESFAARLEAANHEALSRALRRYARARYGPEDVSEDELVRALDVQPR